MTIQQIEDVLKDLLTRYSSVKTSLDTKRVSNPKTVKKYKHNLKVLNKEIREYKAYLIEKKQ